jgi:hypothetical protein
MGQGRAAVVGGSSPASIYRRLCMMVSFNLQHGKGQFALMMV